MYSDRLKAADWEVRPCPLATAQGMVREHHYARGGSNTAVATHGLFRRGDPECQGVAWWLPPTRSAAQATYPADWQAVLSLSRLVVLPGVPKNACSFLLSKSMKLLDREKWPCLVTYADLWQGHTGGIYRAVNWQYIGLTKPQAIWTLDGRMVAKKAGPKTRTTAEMQALGCVKVGSTQKHKFVHIQIRRPVEDDLI